MLERVRGNKSLRVNLCYRCFQFRDQNNPTVYLSGLISDDQNFAKWCPGSRSKTTDDHVSDNVNMTFCYPSCFRSLTSSSYNSLSLHRLFFIVRNDKQHQICSVFTLRLHLLLNDDCLAPLSKKVLIEIGSHLSFLRILLIQNLAI